MLTEVVVNKDESAFTIRSNSECNKRYHIGGMVLNDEIGGIVLNEEVAQENLGMCMWILPKSK